jgi:Flp pilus assembly CpaF family ATPase
LGLLKACGLGCLGGVAWIHGDSALDGLLRLEQLVKETVASLPCAWITDAIDMVVFLDGWGQARRVHQIEKGRDLDGDGYQLQQVDRASVRMRVSNSEANKK